MNLILFEDQKIHLTYAQPVTVTVTSGDAVVSADPDNKGCYLYAGSQVISVIEITNGAKGETIILTVLEREESELITHISTPEEK